MTNVHSAPTSIRWGLRECPSWLTRRCRQPQKAGRLAASPLDYLRRAPARRGASGAAAQRGSAAWSGSAAICPRNCRHYAYQGGRAHEMPHQRAVFEAATKALNGLPRGRVRGIFTVIVRLGQGAHQRSGEGWCHGRQPGDDDLRPEHAPGSARDDCCLSAEPGFSSRASPWERCYSDFGTDKQESADRAPSFTRQSVSGPD